MLYKRSDLDVIEQVRTDPRVREALDLYRNFADALFIDRVRQEDGSMLVWGLSIHSTKSSSYRSGTKSNVKMELFDSLIEKLGQIYRDITGRSPRTVDQVSKKRPFDMFVATLFKAEGLEAPGPYRIRKALETAR